jgi:hypothetical protein
VDGQNWTTADTAGQVVLFCWPAWRGDEEAVSLVKSKLVMMMPIECWQWAAA